MARKQKDEIETAIENALSPGDFIGCRDGHDFIEDVEAVRARIAFEMAVREKEGGRRRIEITKKAREGL